MLKTQREITMTQQKLGQDFIPRMTQVLSVILCDPLESVCKKCYIKKQS